MGNTDTTENRIYFLRITKWNILLLFFHLLIHTLLVFLHIQTVTDESE
jgi:hypothetical protein